MNRAAKTQFSVLFSCLLLTTLVGCDLLGLGPKKAKKVVHEEDAAPMAAPVETKPEAPIAPAADQPLPKNVLVRVGDWTLTIDEFNERLKLLKQGMPNFNEKAGNAKQMVLDELIRQQLLVQDAQNSDIADQKDIKDAVEDFRKTLLVQEVANRLTKNVMATEDDAQQYYNTNKDLFVEPIKWRVSEIVVPDETTAKTLLVQLLQGADFAQTAKSQSKGSTAAKGGQLKEFTKAPFVAMQQAVSNLDVGGVSAVFKGPNGYYIVKVEAKTGGSLRPFADVKTELISGLTLRKQQKVVLDHLNKLATKTKIEVNKDLLGETETK